MSKLVISHDSGQNIVAELKRLVATGKKPSREVLNQLRKADEIIIYASAELTVEANRELTYIVASSSGLKYIDLRSDHVVITVR